MNNSTKIVSQFLDGLVAAHGNLVERLDGTEVIVRKEMIPNKVGLISGGGVAMNLHMPVMSGLECLMQRLQEKCSLHQAQINS